LKVFELIAIGNELLIGKTLNTNIHWISGEITRLGGFVRRAAVVTDELDEISAAVKEAMQRKSDWIITTGGLGPTFDDMTLEGVAMALKRRLVLDKKALEYLKVSYERAKKQGLVKSYGLTEARRKMVLLPERSRALPNSVGTAPGVITKEGNSIIACLPGVPSEMKAIMKESVIPEISKAIGRNYFCEGMLVVSKVIESNLAPFLKKAMKNNPKAYIKSHPKGIVDGASRIELSITTTSSSKKTAEKIVNDTLDEMQDYVLKLTGTVLKREVN
jgi:molybdenum cofactor synthesis domain-containing protein